MKKHLKFYKQCMETGELPQESTAGWYFGGLCGCASVGLVSQEIFDLFLPTQYGYMAGYWAVGNSEDLDVMIHGFTPLRQTIVLFMAAINNEL